MYEKLSGDGVRSDSAAIQELLDSGAALIELPVPAVCYLIDAPLKLHSFQELRLPRYCRIRLADGSNCHMVENADPEGGNRDITIRGGIWDFNNLGQGKNPFSFPDPAYPDYDGLAFFIRNVKNLIIADLTLKDPCTFACTLDTVSYFSVENLIFDFNRGNPRPMNMDGVHLNGNCHYGSIRNLKGACYDDLVALNADEGSDGPITHIDIDGIYAEECHSAVRLLTVKNLVSHIHIHNVHGTFYQYGIGVSKFYEGETTGHYDALVFDNLFMSKSIRHSYLHMSEDYALHSYVYPLLWIESGVRIKNISVSEFYRNEENIPIPTVFVGEDVEIQNFSLKNCYTENRTGSPITFFENHGKIGRFEASNNRIDGGDLYDGI